MECLNSIVERGGESAVRLTFRMATKGLLHLSCTFNHRVYHALTSKAMDSQWNGVENDQSPEAALFVAVLLVLCFEIVLHICIYDQIQSPGRTKLWAHIIIIASITLVIACASFKEEIWTPALVASCAITTLLALYQHVSFLSLTRRSR